MKIFKVGYDINGKLNALRIERAANMVEALKTAETVLKAFAPAAEISSIIEIYK